MTSRVYLDHNATAPARPEALAAFAAAVAGPLNPSSIHAEGRRARALLEEARRRVADSVEARPDQVTFTSGATEAINLALRPGMRSASGAVERLIVCATEHPAVINGHGFGAAVEVVPVNGDGIVDLPALERLLAQGPRALLALQAANNETGVLQPWLEAAALVRAHDGTLFCDAVQALGRTPCAFEDLPADILALSGHKIGGVPGAGALVVRDGAALGGSMIRGGGQENGWRAGTENVPALAAFGAAAQALGRADEAPRLRELRDAFEAGLRRLSADAVVFGAHAPRLPNTSCFAVPGVAADVLLIALDLAGVAVSSGSACASGKVGRSHVLEAMGVEPDLRGGAIRVSVGWSSTERDVAAVIAALGAGLDRMAARRARRAA